MESGDFVSDSSEKSGADYVGAVAASYEYEWLAGVGVAESRVVYEMVSGYGAG